MIINDNNYTRTRNHFESLRLSFFETRFLWGVFIIRVRAERSASLLSRRLRINLPMNNPTAAATINKIHDSNVVGSRSIFADFHLPDVKSGVGEGNPGKVKRRLKPG
jgi:hypothetical protein